MAHTLLISVRFHDDRYHGAGEWPPSPARLFQALVAGAARGCVLTAADVLALAWLEGLAPPTIAAPRKSDGQALLNYVPNNDLDTIGGDPRNIGDIRVAKSSRPRLFDQRTPFVYAWHLHDDPDLPGAQAICTVAERLYQLGRGVDMAWATGEVLATAAAETRLQQHGGAVYRPASEVGLGMPLASPQVGSLASLLDQFAAQRTRFGSVVVARKVQTLFARAPKARFTTVQYDCPAVLLLFDLRKTSADRPFAPWPLTGASGLVRLIRDGAVQRLGRAQPERQQHFEATLVGSKDTPTPAAQRVRILPLPSIGHAYADRAIRRVLIEVPPDCPVTAADIHWAVSGLTIAEYCDDVTGEVTEACLSPADDDRMLGHFGIGTAKHRVWRTVTPVAVSLRAGNAARGQTGGPRGGGTDRAMTHRHVAFQVAQALRHAGIHDPVHAIVVQQEPFEARGVSAGDFADLPRFDASRLWHVEIEFIRPISGPLVIGDARHLGLGVMAPAVVGTQACDGVHAFDIVTGLLANPAAVQLCEALRRAVMARVQSTLPPRAPLPPFFTGHTADGAPVRGLRHEHLAYGFDATANRLLILAPHILEGRDATRTEATHLLTLAEALAGFVDLRAGPGGRLTLLPVQVGPQDALFAPSHVWHSTTDYRVNRHTKQGGAQKALTADVLAECHRRGLPEPVVTTLWLHGEPGEGLVGGVRLNFAVAVRGPLWLGRDRHKGGGQFRGG